ncbi:hypothetical protein [Massilia phyllosphaerae]|uniref:hypothetical protein n=1 Tax=Massilia phyllosphaerae TaxID=3106034 RepID=UPI002B1CD403|nr:hypothetical protein [Massilia sp. SGZ-792]
MSKTGLLAVGVAGRIGRRRPLQAHVRLLLLLLAHAAFTLLLTEVFEGVALVGYGGSRGLGLRHLLGQGRRCDRGCEGDTERREETP